MNSKLTFLGIVTFLIGTFAPMALLADGAGDGNAEMLAYFFGTAGSVARQKHCGPRGAPPRAAVATVRVRERAYGVCTCSRSRWKASRPAW